MESTFRGRGEKELDRVLKPEVIATIVKISKNIPLKSVEDFCFGYIVARALLCRASQDKLDMMSCQD